MVGFENVQASLVLGLVAAVVCYLLLVRPSRSIPPKAPPGSFGWPLLGETLAFLAPHRSNSIGSFIQSRIQRYGKVFRSHLFGWPTVVSCDLELNTFVLQNEGKLFSANYPKAMLGILGNQSILMASGEIHKKMRSVTVGFANSSRSAPRFLSWVERLATEMMDRWEEVGQVEFCKEAKLFGFNVTVKTLLGLTPEEAASKGILQDFHTFMKGFFSLPINLPGTTYTKAVKASESLCLKMKKIIEEKRQNLGKKTDSEGDFLDTIISKGDLNDEEIAIVAIDILFGGYETIATLMSLIVYFLPNAPAALSELTEEHRKIQREKLAAGEKYLSIRDYKNMDFTLKVINEALRCGNVIKYVYRKALQDVEFKGYVIPRGWQVLPISTGIHLDPSLHTSPFEFDPWRWTDEATGKKVTPFGGGIRLCPGAALAQVETAFFIHHLVLRFSWKVKGGDCPLSHPYVEFAKGLPLEIQSLNKMMS
uniref:Cytochrome P450 724B1 n=1 Tax=Kalanchoe fedtschenkoi TaxID=63787 RepID=A0A7N0RGM4_KALFE